jgi:hypothetical protein
LVVHDCFETEKEHNYKTIFRFADLKISHDDSTKNVFIKSIEKLAMIPISKKNIIKLEITENYFGSHAKNIKTPTTIIESLHKGIFHSTYLFIGIENLNYVEKIKVSQVEDELKCSIIIEDENGVKNNITFDNNPSSENDLLKISNV